MPKAQVISIWLAHKPFLTNHPLQSLLPAPVEMEYFKHTFEKNMEIDPPKKAS